MDYTTLGRTGLKASVAGLGGGGGSQLGLDRGGSPESAMAIVRLALDLGINVIDTAEGYMTEAVIGDALRGVDRSSLILASKHHIAPYGAKEGFYTGKQVVAGLEASLRALKTDYLDIYYLHALTAARFDHAMGEIVPALLREQEKGKFRFLGATEAPTFELQHDGIRMALDRDMFDVVMIGFQMFHQNARERVFPKTVARNVGTMLMFVVRNIFADPDHMRATIRRLADEGKVPHALAEKDNALDFLIHPGGVETNVEAAYRFARHEPGTHVVLFGTGNPDHLRSNIRAINAPPLPAADQASVCELFGQLVGVGLDIPNRVPPSARK
jgi:aryl-alcohol dehydrogenase-like predicted oxidoreductase